MLPGASGAPGQGGAPQPPVVLSQGEREKIYNWIIELTSPDTRENALQELRYKHTGINTIKKLMDDGC